MDDLNAERVGQSRTEGLSDAELRAVRDAEYGCRRAAGLQLHGDMGVLYGMAWRQYLREHPHPSFTEWLSAKLSAPENPQPGGTHDALREPDSEAQGGRLEE